jgi:hypothetical protein
MENGREVFDPSYFAIQTGRDNVSLLVWPGSHHVSAEFERFADACKSKEANPGLLVHDKLTLQNYEMRLCGDLKPQQDNISPSLRLLAAKIWYMQTMHKMDLNRQ